VQKADIDSAAAAVILGRWFAGERSNLMTGKDS
jgi:RNase H-fold protein (predicted Holliday junction resolvase)